MLCIANEQARRYIRSLGHKVKNMSTYLCQCSTLSLLKPGLPLESIFPTVPPVALDLMRRMLAFNPQKRLSIEQALAHPYFESLHDETVEVRCKCTGSIDCNKSVRVQAQVDRSHPLTCAAAYGTREIQL